VQHHHHQRDQIGEAVSQQPHVQIKLILVFWYRMSEIYNLYYLNLLGSRTLRPLVVTLGGGADAGSGTGSEDAPPPERF
jgi:hypothetical protein